MKLLLTALLTLPVQVAMAAGSGASSSVNGTGAAIQGQAQAVLPGQTVTLNIGGGQPPSLIQSANTAPPGTASTSTSVSLSVGGILGGGFGQTSGATQTLNGAVPTTTLSPTNLNGQAHANGILGF